MSQFDVRLRNDAGSAHGVPDRLLDMPHDQPGVDAIDVQSRKRSPPLPAGQSSQERRMHEVSPDPDELHRCLLPEQRLPQQLRWRGRLVTDKHAMNLEHVPVRVMPKSYCRNHGLSTFDSNQRAIRNYVSMRTSSRLFHPRGSGR